MRYVHSNSISRYSVSNNGVPYACLLDHVSATYASPYASPYDGQPCPCSCRNAGYRPCPPQPPCPPYPPFPPYPPCPPFPPFPPTPELFPYVVNYYANSIDQANILGSISGFGHVGDTIAVDLTLFAPAGYQTPGVRSGANTISADPANNVVNVVYSPQLLSFVVEYYAGAVAPGNLLGVSGMSPVPYGTIITLTPLQLDAYLPSSGYGNGMQVGGPTTIVTNGQVITVLYPELP